MNLKSAFAFFLLVTAISTSTVRAADIWEPVHNPPDVVRPRDIDVDKHGTLYTCDLDAGFFMSKDSGKTWVSINGPGLFVNLKNNRTNGLSIQVDPATGDLIAGQMSPTGGQYSSSVDHGKNWTRVEGYAGGVSAAPDRACFLPNGDILFGCYNPSGKSFGVFYSTDHGKTCTRAKAPPDSGGSALAIGYNPVTKDCWMGSDKEVFRSADLGRTWDRLPTPAGDARHMTFNTAGDILIERVGGVFRSQGQGKSWEQVYDCGTDLGGAGLLRTDPNGYLYVGNSAGGRKNPPIARSTKNGDKGSWVDWSSGIPSKWHGTSIVWNPTDGRMYCTARNDDDKPTRPGQIYRTIEPVFKPGAKNDK